VPKIGFQLQPNATIGLVSDCSLYRCTDGCPFFDSRLTLWRIMLSQNS
jgi:hypothetical protein